MSRNREDYQHAIMSEARSRRDSAFGDAARRHLHALSGPRDGFEKAIVQGLYGLAEYAAAYEVRFGDAIGTDGVLGVAFAEQLRAWRKLLNGELGRLDGGYLDGAAQAIWHMAGFGPEEL